MTVFWIGVSGFSYPSWKGTFYPEDTKPDKMLGAYSSKLNSVEINSSFYHMPTQKITSKWARSTPQNFCFSFKANRRITHIKKLSGAIDDSRIFFEGVKPLEAKLGCILVQLPPYLKQDYNVLEAFLREKPEAVRMALEFRHNSWFGPGLNDLLSKYDTALCVADTEDMKPVFERTTNFTYVRLRQDQYSKDSAKGWAEKLLNFSRDACDCFVYFKHDETGATANLAAEFRVLLNG